MNGRATESFTAPIIGRAISEWFKRHFKGAFIDHGVIDNYGEPILTIGMAYDGYEVTVVQYPYERRAVCSVTDTTRPHITTLLTVRHEYALEWSDPDSFPNLISIVRTMMEETRFSKTARVGRLNPIEDENDRAH